MPNVGSWNNKWTGEGNTYILNKSFKKEDSDDIIAKGPYYYDFGDGWTIKITATHYTTTERNKLKKANSGFMGYEWMVDSIIKHRKIKTNG